MRHPHNQIIPPFRPAEDRVTHPASLSELYERAPPVAARIVGGVSHVVSVSHGGGIAEECPHAEASFSPRTRVVRVRIDIGDRLSRFLAGEFTSGGVGNELRERWHLSMIKGDLAVLFHECLHGVGWPNSGVARHEWRSYWQFPHVAVLNEGVSELASELFLGAFITELGLHEIDPRILEVKPVRSAFAAQAEAVRTLATTVADLLGTSLETEVRLLARDGGAQLALWRLTARVGLAPTLSPVEPLQAPAGLVGLRRLLEKPLAELGGEWARGAPTEGIEADRTMGQRWGSAVPRGLPEVVRRIHAGARGLPDVERLADELARAAQAAQADLGATLDAVSEALSLLEMGEM